MPTQNRSRKNGDKTHTCRSSRQNNPRQESGKSFPLQKSRQGKSRQSRIRNPEDQDDPKQAREQETRTLIRRINEYRKSLGLPLREYWTEDNDETFFSRPWDRAYTTEDDANSGQLNPTQRIKSR